MAQRINCFDEPVLRIIGIFFNGWLPVDLANERDAITPAIVLISHTSQNDVGAIDILLLDHAIERIVLGDCAKISLFDNGLPAERIVGIFHFFLTENLSNETAGSIIRIFRLIPFSIDLGNEMKGIIFAGFFG